MLKKIDSALNKSGEFFNKIFLHPAFFAALFVASVIIGVFDLEVGGAIAFAWVIITALILCENIFATVLPFLLMCVFLTDCYDSYDTFIGYVWLIIPLTIAVLFHFIVYRKRIVIGESFFGLIAITVALFLGGLGFISPEDYFSGAVIYHTVFLGLGMVVSYILLKSHMDVERDKDPKETLLKCFYIMGILAGTIVLIYRVSLLLKAPEPGTRFQESNNLSTFLMFAIPCPFYFAAKKRFGWLHLMSAVFMLSMAMLSHSRGGLLFGTIEFVVCIFVFAIIDRKYRWLHITCSAIAFIAILIGAIYVLIVLFLKYGLSMEIDSKIFGWISDDEARVVSLQRLWDKFERFPIFGHGLGYDGNLDLYTPRKGAMPWYHMIVPQIIGGMGIVGAVAYGYHFVQRCIAVVKGIVRSDNRAAVVTLALSYMGVLLMSLVNPGLFCPLPYSLMAVMIFVLIDGRITRCVGEENKPKTE